MVSAQEWFDKKYPQETRKEITSIWISSMKLEGKLNLNNFVSLQDLSFHANELTNLIIKNCPNINKLYCSNSLLTNFDFLNKGKLTVLDISHNNFPAQGLAIFSSLINLEELYLSNNSFFGSLEPLQNLGKLKELFIKNTNVNKGLEYLSESLERIYCDGQLAKQLRNHAKKDGKEDVYYDYQAWRNIQYFSQQLRLFQSQLTSQEKEILSLKEELTKFKEENQQFKQKFFQTEVVNSERYLKSQKKELERTKKRIVSELSNEGREELEYFLELQTDFINNNSLNKLEKLEKIKRKLQEELIKKEQELEEIDEEILVAQIEIPPKS